MKWIFRIILLIFAVFGGLCVYGYFLPATQTIERSIDIDADVNKIFPYLVDLKAYRYWAPLHLLIEDAELVYGGADVGVGQKLLWQNGPKDFPAGEQEIIQSQVNEFVTVQVTLPDRVAISTHAVFAFDDNVANRITVLTRSEIDQGGFPYIQRIRGKVTQGRYEEIFDTALNRLKTVVESE